MWQAHVSFCSILLNYFPKWTCYFAFLRTVHNRKLYFFYRLSMFSRVVLIAVSLICLLCGFIGVLICIPLMTNPIQHLLMCLLNTHISSLVMYLFKSFAHFSGLFSSQNLRVIYIFWIANQAYEFHFSPQSVAYLCILNWMFLVMFDILTCFFNGLYTSIIPNKSLSNPAKHVLSSMSYSFKCYNHVLIHFYAQSLNVS